MSARFRDSSDRRGIRAGKIVLIAVICGAGVGVTGVSRSIVVSESLAQQAQSAGPVSLGELFDTSEDPTSSIFLAKGAGDRFRQAVQKARAAWDSRAPGQCPRPRIVVTVIKGDPIFQAAVAGARVDNLRAVLGRDADSFTFVTNHEGSTSNVEIDTSVEDIAPPTITVSPPSGHKVRNGQRLRVTVTATEPSTGWQAGIRQVQIEDVDRATNYPPWNNPAPTPAPCANAGLTRTVEIDYQVPDNVLIGRLKITARDYHSPQQAIVVEYPTGDWQGRLRWKARQTGAGTLGEFWGEMEIVLDHDGKGNLEGRLTGTQNQFIGGPCQSKTATPGRLTARLTGSYTASAKKMSINLVNPQFTPPQIPPCKYGGQPPMAAPSVHTWPQFNDVLRNPVPRAGGGFQSSQSHPIPQGTAEYNLILRQAGGQ